MSSNIGKQELGSASDTNKKPKLRSIKKLALGSSSAKRRALLQRKQASRIDLRMKNAERQIDIPSNAQTLSIYRGELGCHRLFIGHFNSSRAPYFRKPEITVKREPDLQTEIQKVLRNGRLSRKLKELEIQKCMLYSYSISIAHHS